MKSLVLFNCDWDQSGFARQATQYPFDTAGFDLFSFPSNARLVGFDLERFTSRLAAKATRRGWGAVVSNHEQFGALAAAMLAERLGWPGTPVVAVLACQHKLHARRVLAQVCPEANCGFQTLPAAYGEAIPEGLTYPSFVKPVKAAFSVLARTVDSREALHAHTRFGAWELWVIRHLVEPFERVVRSRLPEAGTAHSMLLEEPAPGLQYNLDGYAYNGQRGCEVRALGVVDAVHYPGTQAFMRFDYPGQCDPSVQARALDVARRFLGAVGFTHGLFNMEFFYDAPTDRLTVIEFNPRMASQFSDLYLRVDGIDLHALALALAWGKDPATVPRSPPVAGAASSFVYRSFDPAAKVPMPSAAQRAQVEYEFPGSLLFCYPKDQREIQRDFKWLGSYRYGILHLGARDASTLQADCERASAMLGWPAPC